jgi:quinoprotein glucose dehydrogenase
MRNAFTRRKIFRGTNLYVLLPILLALPSLYLMRKSDMQTTDWRNYGGDSGGSRYSPLQQINLTNVKNLQPAWTYDTNENKDTTKRGMDIQCQPIVVDGILYGTTPRMKAFALHASTGKAIWTFDPFENPAVAPRFHPLRGLAYWESQGDRRILYSVGPTLYAVDARTGKRIPSFGTNGEVSLHQGLGTPEQLGYDVNRYSIRSTSPGAIYKDLLIMGSSVSEGGDALPGNIRAFNVRTGKLAWSFRTIPLPGEAGYETWSPDSYRKLGGANAWAGMVVDENRGMVFMGTGSPSVDFYGGAREGQNLFANCVIALDANTGKRIWHFQTIHHDLWDHDIPCPPNLIRVRHNGKMTDAVAQATKDGYVFVFNRDNGEPLFPVRETPVPTSPALPGEKPWPTQPIPEKPLPFARQFLTEADITRRTPAAQAYVTERFNESRKGNKYLPPSLEGTLYYGFGGGAEWGGAATDPEGTFYVNGNNMLWWMKMRENPAIQPSETRRDEGSLLYDTHCSVCHGPMSENKTPDPAFPPLKDIARRMSAQNIEQLVVTGRGRMPSFQHLSAADRKAIVQYIQSKPTEEPQEGQRKALAESQTEKKDFPYQPPFLPNGMVQFRDPENFPAIQPPWGTLNAIDLNTGEYRWSVPLGYYPSLHQEGEPPTGTENHGGPLVTAGGLLFIAATYDQHLRAFDTRNGQEVWKYKLPAGGFATPITYQVDGRQYIAIAAGGVRYGLRPGSHYLAFALPEP